MSHSGCALVWHVQPRVVIFSCRTHYRPSSVKCRNTSLMRRSYCNRLFPSNFLTGQQPFTWGPRSWDTPLTILPPQWTATQHTMDRLATRQEGVKGRQRNIIHYVDVPGRRALRSAGTNRLAVPPVRLATVGSRAFPVAAAHTWNSLPQHIVWASTLQSFKRHLKTFLLQQSLRLAL